MKRLFLLVVLLGVLTVSSLAQEPSAPTIGAFSPDGGVVEVWTTVDLSCGFSDLGGDLWLVELLVTGPYEDAAFTLWYDRITDQLGRGGYGCSPGENRVLPGPPAVLCEFSTVEGDGASMTVSWRIVNELGAGTWSFTARAADKRAATTVLPVGSIQSVVLSAWPSGYD